MKREIVTGSRKGGVLLKTIPILLLILAMVLTVAISATATLSNVSATGAPSTQYSPIRAYNAELGTSDHYNLTYIAGAHGNISGSASQTVNSGDDGSPVTAVPDTCYHFVSWNDSSTANPRTDHEVSTNITKIANFSINTSIIRASAGANGNIAPSGNVTVNCSANQSFTIIPNTGYGVAAVLVDSVSKGNVTTWNFTSVTANHTIAVTFSLKANSQTGLASSLRTSTYGQAVTFTAKVVSRSGTPTGTVTFMDGDTIIAPNVTLVGNSATCTTSVLTTGSHAITAVYNGDNNFNSSTSSTRNQRVEQARTSTSVTSSNNPASHNTWVNFTATVTVRAPGSGTPTGNITFKEKGSTLYTVALDGSGQATYNTSSLSVGVHRITAVYSGDSEFRSGTSATFQQRIQQPTPTPTPTPDPTPTP